MALKQTISKVDRLIRLRDDSFPSDASMAFRSHSKDYSKMKPVKIVPDTDIDTNLCIALILGIGFGFVLAILTGAS